MVIVKKSKSVVEFGEDILYYAKKLLITEPTAILLAIFCSFFILSWVVLMIPIYLYRFVLGMTFKYFRPDLDTLLRNGPALFASSETFYNTPQNNTIGVVKVKGIPKVEEFHQIANKVLDLKLANGKLKYPELKQYPYKWMGYYFWKNDEKFDIANHVTYYSNPDDGKLFTDAEAVEIETKFQNQNFIKQRSLWNIVILPNVENVDNENANETGEKYSIVYVIVNHCYADGYSMAKLIFVDLAGYKLDSMPQPKYDMPKRNIFQKIFFLLCTVIFAAYDFFRPAVVGNTLNVWNVMHWKMKNTHVSSKPIRIPIQYLKDIRHKHNTYLPSVIIAGWIGALRKSGKISRRGKVLNRKITVTIPVPMPKHPDHLDIHASVINIQFPIGIEDPVERLKQIDKYLQKQKKSKALAVVLALKPIFGRIFPGLVGSLYPVVPTAAVFNIFPGPEYVARILDYEVVGVYFSFGQTKARFSTLLSSLTYNKHITLKTSVNTAIFKTSAEIDEFNSFIQEEFELLANAETKTEELDVLV